MKPAIPIILSILVISCRQPVMVDQSLLRRVDSLENRLASQYKPGFGEFMSSIQSHHAKLWFAGQRQNWKLCDFEIHEIMEAIDDIKVFQTERKESSKIVMLQPAIDSINYAIRQKNPLLFKSSYNLLTNTCNSCHRATDFEFNVVKVPDLQTFSNQDFSGSGN